jgi:hypothetical protein
MYVFSALGGMGTMSDEFKDLAQVAADAVVSAMARARSEQARDWFTRLQDLLDSNPGLAPAHDAAGSRNCPVSGPAKTCTPLWQHGNGFTAGGSPVIAGGVLFVNAPGNGDADAFSR